MEPFGIIVLAVLTVGVLLLVGKFFGKLVALGLIAVLGIALWTYGPPGIDTVYHDVADRVRTAVAALT